MKRKSLRRASAPLLALTLAFSLALPASALFWNKKSEAPYVEDFSKNGLIGSAIVFDPADFVVKPDKKASLAGITVDQLPDPGAGMLNIGGQPLEPGACVDVTALAGLRFQCAEHPTVTTATLLFTPAFSDCQGGRQTTVSLYLLTEENNPPVARNMELTTYKKDRKSVV